MQNEKLQNMWSKVIDNHRYIYWNGEVIFKQYLNSDEPSVVLDKKGWNNWRVI